MSETFLQRWVQKLSNKAQSFDTRPVQVFAGAFGKHPAWNDHVPDLGLQHPTLVDFKRAIYEGITGNVDNGQWDKLQQSKKLAPFGHTLLHRFSGGAVLGRLWYSQDGKGRDAYPMVIVLLWLGATSDEAFKEILVFLPKVQMSCQEATSHEQVMNALNTLQSFAAEQTTKQPSAAPKSITQMNSIPRLIDNPQLGPDHQGMFRILYHIERELLINLSPADIPLKAKLDPNHIAAVRVPLCAKTPTHAARNWIKFLNAGMGLPGPLLALAPDHGGWLDLVIGQPGTPQLYCLRAATETIPFTTEIPYTLEPEFVDRARLVMAKCKLAIPA
jgi:hypothetical protein